MGMAKVCPAEVLGVGLEPGFSDCPSPGLGSASWHSLLIYVFTYFCGVTGDGAQGSLMLGKRSTPSHTARPPSFIVSR